MVVTELVFMVISIGIAVFIICTVELLILWLKYYSLNRSSSGIRSNNSNSNGRNSNNILVIAFLVLVILTVIKDINGLKKEIQLVSIIISYCCCSYYHSYYFHIIFVIFIN